MGSADGIKGSDGYFWNLWHVVQFSIKSVHCLLRLGHQIEFLDLSLHLEMPMWSLCSVSRMSKHNGSGMMILLPCISSFCMVISPATEIWFKHTRCVFHFCLARNVFSTQLFADKSHLCFDILLSCLCIYLLLVSSGKQNWHMPPLHDVPHLAYWRLILVLWTGVSSNKIFACYMRNCKWEVLHQLHLESLYTDGHII